VADLLRPGMTGVVGYDVSSAELAPGQELRGVRWLAVGRDLAQAGSEIRRKGSGSVSGRISGQVTSLRRAVAGATVSFFGDGALSVLSTQARTDEDGFFSAELPPGQYHVRASGRGNGERVHVPGRAREVTEGHEPSPVELVTIEPDVDSAMDFSLGAPGRLRLEVRDDRGRPAAAKLLFQRETELPPPLHSAGERQPYRALGIAQVDWTLGGTTEAVLPQGLYTVTASRGPRQEPVVLDNVPVGLLERSVSVNFSPALGPRGYVALDSHLHGADSGHGEVTREERLITALAEGLDVVVSTDHDTIIDYAPVARALGIEQRLLTINGMELTYRTGHHNLWPLRAEPSRANGGAVKWWLDDPGLDSLYATYGALGARVKQLNHGASYFKGWGYDAATGVGREDAGYTSGFNAMELHNAKGSGGKAELIPIWFSLLDAGRRVAPLAASDSHTRIPEPGSGRTYVWLGNVAVSSESVSAAVEALHTVASTGPLIELTSSDHTPVLGEDVTVLPDTPLELEIRVWAPAYCSVEVVRLIGNGEILQSFTPGSAARAKGAPGLQLEQRVSLQPRQDTWYVVEVTGNTEMAPVMPGMTPWAMTAPVFADADGVAGFTARNAEH
jgi:hypothetical protein